MKLQPESKKELLRIACGVSLCTAVMWVVFAALHLVGWVVFDYRVLLGGIIGVAGGVIGSLFHIGVNYATAIRGAHPWILYLLPVGGLPSWGCISSAIWRARAPTPSSSRCISAKACPFSWCR